MFDVKSFAGIVLLDNRIHLRYYYQIADHLLRQASIHRNQKNVFDLYITLVRLSSLISETIAFHIDFRASPLVERSWCKEILKAVVHEIQTLEQKFQFRVNAFSNAADAASPASLGYSRPPCVSSSQLSYQDGHTHVLMYTDQPQKSETLYRHSYQGFGLGAEMKVQYPINGDAFHGADSSSLNQARRSVVREVEDGIKESTFKCMATSFDNGTCLHKAEGRDSYFSSMMEYVRQPSHPAVLAQLHQVSATATAPTSKFPDVPSAYRHLHVPVRLMEEFMRIAEINTQRNLETCGVLAGSLKNGVYHITTLMIPKQKATSNTCETSNEEELLQIQSELSLVTLGWIHTHPSQSCFMSSVDVHTHCSYQMMLPEAIAIVMAPTDRTRQHGIFHLCDPGGLSVIRKCQQRGFHQHEGFDTIYEDCSHVYMNSSLKFDVVDLR